MTDVLRETSYDINTLSKFINENEPKLLEDQQVVYLTIIKQVNNINGGIYFLDAPGRTGKTFVTNLLLTKIRQKNIFSTLNNY